MKEKSLKSSYTDSCGLNLGISKSISDSSLSAALVYLVSIA